MQQNKLMSKEELSKLGETLKRAISSRNTFGYRYTANVYASEKPSEYPDSQENSEKGFTCPFPTKENFLYPQYFFNQDGKVILSPDSGLNEFIPFLGRRIYWSANGFLFEGTPLCYNQLSKTFTLLKIEIITNSFISDSFKEGDIVEVLNPQGFVIRGRVIKIGVLDKHKRENSNYAYIYSEIDSFVMKNAYIIQILKNSEKSNFFNSQSFYKYQIRLPSSEIVWKLIYGEDIYRPYNNPDKVMIIDKTYDVSRFKHHKNRMAKLLEHKSRQGRWYAVYCPEECMPDKGTGELSETLNFREVTNGVDFTTLYKVDDFVFHKAYSFCRIVGSKVIEVTKEWVKVREISEHPHEVVDLMFADPSNILYKLDDVIETDVDMTGKGDMYLTGAVIKRPALDDHEVNPHIKYSDLNGMIHVSKESRIAKLAPELKNLLGQKVSFYSWRSGKWNDAFVIDTHKGFPIVYVIETKETRIVVDPRRIKIDPSVDSSGINVLSSHSEETIQPSAPEISSILNMFTEIMKR